MAQKILVVDDAPKSLKLLADLLAVKGYSVVTADGGAAALRQVAAENPDLVLLDVMMPDMDGFEVCRRLKADRAVAGGAVCRTRDSPEQESGAAVVVFWGPGKSHLQNPWSHGSRRGALLLRRQH
jgi:CheY-like chemotaxis protein